MAGYPESGTRSMSRATPALLALLAALTLAVPGSSRAETLSPPTVGYSADMVIASAGSKQAVRISRDGAKSRLTVAGPQGPGSSSVATTRTWPTCSCRRRASP